MWKIRTEQLQTFEADAQRKFEAAMLARLTEFAPEHAQGVGPDGLRRLIALGQKKAAGHHLTLMGPVRFFLELMVLYGCDFDTDPLLPWAGGYLTTDRHINELHRADHLHSLAQDYHIEVIGSSYELEIAALQRVLAKPTDEWLKESGRDDAALIEEVYPEKCQRAGPAAVAAVVSEADAAARSHQLPPGPGRRLLAGLMVAFGHGCVTDPQYRWIAEVLVETTRLPGEQRVDRLATRATAYCTHALTVLEGP